MDASCQVERLRAIAGSANIDYAVQIMPPPSYLQALLYEGNSATDENLTSDIVLVYKTNIKTSTSSLPLDVRDQINESCESDIELGGDPLPAPFGENDDIDVSVSERKQYQWPKGELNHLQLKMGDAINILNNSSDDNYDGVNTLDVWCLTNSGSSTVSQGLPPTSNNSINGNGTVNGLSMLDADISSSFIDTKVNKKIRLMLCRHATEDLWSRSFVESQGICSITSPEMDPQTMKKSHLDISQMPEHMMSAVVLCRYNIDGQRVTSDAATSPSAFSVNLELKWKQLSVSVPLQEASAKVILQAAVGHKSSPAYNIFRQLCVLHRLFELYFTCWRDKTTPEALPYLNSSEDSFDNVAPQDSLHCRIKTLIYGGQQALQAQNANRRMSVAPAMLGRQSIVPGSFLGRQSIAPGGLGRKSIVPGFLGRMSLAPPAKDSNTEERKHVSLNEATEIAAAGTRENSDVIDGLFNLLLECKSLRELTSTWDVIFMEFDEAKRPFIRPKNVTRAAKLITSIVSGEVNNVPSFLDIEGSLYPLELVIEMGLEKLTTDYYYIFRESQLVGRDELQAPVLLQAGLGVPREKWLTSCGNLMGWLAQVHSALEIVMPLPQSLSKNSVPHITSRALKYFQSDKSPVRGVAGLLSPGGSIQEFSIGVTAEAVREHTNKNFDWWRMTLTSECAMKKVRSVFLRSHLQPIFPPQLCENNDILLPSENEDNVQYYCAEATTISEKI